MRIHFRLMLVLVFLAAASMIGVAHGAETVKPAVDPSIYGHVSSLVWVVKDLDPVVSYWEKLGLRNIRRTDVTAFQGLIYRGKPTATTAKSAFGQIGTVSIEWIQPVTGVNLYAEFLKRHGDGVLALAFAVPSESRLEEQIRYFQSRGVQVAQRTQWTGVEGNGHGAYLDTAGKGGGFTLALYHDPDASLVTRAAHAAPNETPLTQPGHYAFVARNIRQIGEYWQNLGFGAMQIDHNVSLDRSYRGQPGKFEMDLGWWRWGDLPVEWVQTTQGPNVYEEYLAKHGEGFHHFGVDVKDMDAAAELMASRGAPRSQWGGWDSGGDKGRFAYLDTDPHGGVTLELIWDQPQSK